MTNLNLLLPLLSLGLASLLREFGLCPAVTESPPRHPPASELSSGHGELLGVESLLSGMNISPPLQKHASYRESDTEGENTETFVIILIHFV